MKKPNTLNYPILFWNIAKFFQIVFRYLKHLDRLLVTILNALINIFLSFVAEIADNASLSCVEETGSSATESDSIGSLRNSSPENINTVASLTTLAGSCSSKDLGLSHKNKGISHGNRISSPSPRINR